MLTCICLMLDTSSAKQVNDMLSDDLDMTTAALKQHPKVYWIWNHRRWCLEHIPEGSDDTEGDPLEWRKKNWARELFVVEKMLDADARNCELSDFSNNIYDHLTTFPISSCMELSALRTCKYASKAHKPLRVDVHYSQDRGQLFQL
jgi:hypothetical protein